MKDNKNKCLEKEAVKTAENIHMLVVSKGFFLMHCRCEHLLNVRQKAATERSDSISFKSDLML